MNPLDHFQPPPSPYHQGPSRDPNEMFSAISPLLLLLIYQTWCYWLYYSTEPPDHCTKPLNRHSITNYWSMHSAEICNGHTAGLLFT